MPVGKNSIKRVQNGGYSNVKSEAPDMLNSEIAEDATVIEKKPVVAKKSAPVSKKQTNTPAKKTAPKVKNKPDEPKVAVGDDMPVFLL